MVRNEEAGGQLCYKGPGLTGFGKGGCQGRCSADSLLGHPDNCLLCLYEKEEAIIQVDSIH